VCSLVKWCGVRVPFYFGIAYTRVFFVMKGNDWNDWKFSKEFAAAGTELTKYLTCTYVNTKSVNLILKLIKCHTVINRGTVIHPSYFQCDRSVSISTICKVKPNHFSRKSQYTVRNTENYDTFDADEKGNPLLPLL
jgi:hypothetical protein